MQPNHILTILAVADVERSAAFYARAFGWPRRVDEPVYVEFELPGERGLGLYRREGYARNVGRLPQAVEGDDITSAELYFRCADLDEAIARMEAAGGRALSPRAARLWGDEAAYFADPDGNVLVLARPL